MTVRRHRPDGRPAVVSFVGRSGSGKTTLLERLIPTLRARGWRVATLKHHAHPQGVDRPGKDTHRHVAAGADRTVLSSPTQVAFFESRESEADPRELVARFFPGADWVLTEGFKRGPFPKIEVARRALETALITTPAEGLVAAVCDFDPAVPVPRFGLEDANALADFLEETFMSPDATPEWSALVQVDGKEIPVKEFVADVFIGVVLGLVRTLKGVADEPKAVNIELRRRA